MKAASQKMKICETHVRFVKILSKSLDASDKEQFYYEVSIVVSVPTASTTRKTFLYTLKK